MRNAYITDFKLENDMTLEVDLSNGSYFRINLESKIKDPLVIEALGGKCGRPLKSGGGDGIMWRNGARLSLADMIKTLQAGREHELMLYFNKQANSTEYTPKLVRHAGYVLARGGIGTMDALCEKTGEEIKKIRDAGEKVYAAAVCVREIYKAEKSIN